jgi:flagellar basal body-associated protein FliL
MADENNKEEQSKQEQPEQSKQEQPEQSKPEQKDSGEKTSKKGFLKWIILAGVVVFCAGAGFGLGRLFGRSGADDENTPAQQTETSQAPPLKANPSQKDLKETWYYDFEPVVANLNEPGATRYIRLALTLQISKALDLEKGTAYIEEKIPVLRNWLTIYLASQTVEDTRGNRNLMRIQSEILDAFNERLFPDSKYQIKSVFFKDFAIQ